MGLLKLSSISQHLSNDLQSISIQFNDVNKSFIGIKFFKEYSLITCNLSSTTSSFNCSKDKFIVALYPDNPDTIKIHPFYKIS